MFFSPEPEKDETRHSAWELYTVRGLIGSHFIRTGTTGNPKTVNSYHRLLHRTVVHLVQVSVDLMCYMYLIVSMGGEYGRFCADDRKVLPGIDPVSWRNKSSLETL